ncbi:MAG: hypothetical protein QXU67_03020 [Candidatus Bathyarchaeia archaeon]
MSKKSDKQSSLEKDKTLIVYSNEKFPHSIIPLKIDQVKREVVLYEGSVVNGSVFANKVRVLSKYPSDVIIKRYVYGKEAVEIQGPALIGGAVVTDGEILLGRTKTDDYSTEGSIKILGPLFASRNITVLNNVTIYGNIISKTGNIKTGENCQIYGTVSGNIVNIGANTFIMGVVAVKELNINHHVTILDSLIRCQQGKIVFPSNMKWLRCLTPNCFKCNRFTTLEEKATCHVYLNDRCKEYSRISIEDKTEFKGGEILNGSRREYLKDSETTRHALEMLKTFYTHLKEESKTVKVIQKKSEIDEMIAWIEEARRKVMEFIEKIEL